jgi:hypothetical protein
MSLLAMKIVRDCEQDSPFDSMESLRLATKISAQCNIVQDVVVPVQCWVHKANGALANGSSFLIELQANVSDESCNLKIGVTNQSQNRRE